jgi:hypothetical protein
LVAAEILKAGRFTLEAVHKMTLAEWKVIDIPPGLGKRMGEKVKEFLTLRREWGREEVFDTSSFCT